MKKMLLIVLLSLFAGLQVSVANSIRVEGYVYDSKDVGLNGVQVSTKDDYKNYETTTDNYQGDGFYYLEGLRIGTYTFKYEKTGYQTQSMDASFENDYETIQLRKITMVSNPTSTPSPIPSPRPPSGSSIVFGFVNDSNDNELKDVTVTLDGADYSKSVVTDEDGFYEFRNLSAGDYTLTCEKEGYETYTHSISLRENEVKDLDRIVLEKTVYGITGTWKGYLNSNLGYVSITVEMEQYEDGTFVGSYESSGGGYGPVGGKLKGRTFKFKLKNRASGCSGSFSGKGRLSDDGEQIRFSFSGKDCNGKQSGNGKIYLQD